MSGIRAVLPGIKMIFAIAIMLLIASGCTTLSRDRKSTGTTAGSTGPKTATVYYDFDDVVVPKEMKVNRDATFIYETGGLKAGVLDLQGRVDFASLINFFEVNMQKDNWRLVSRIKTPSTLMLFQKESRLCVIVIDEASYYTYARVWLAPVFGDMSSGLLK